MTLTLDYAQAFENRRRRRSIRYLGVMAVWLGLFLIRPRLAMALLRGRDAVGYGYVNAGNTV